jgi:hypothetical protein
MLSLLLGLSLSGKTTRPIISQNGIRPIVFEAPVDQPQDKSQVSSVGGGDTAKEQPKADVANIPGDSPAKKADPGSSSNQDAAANQGKTDTGNPPNQASPDSGNRPNVDAGSSEKKPDAPAPPNGDTGTNEKKPDSGNPPPQDAGTSEQKPNSGNPPDQNARTNENKGFVPIDARTRGARHGLVKRRPKSGEPKSVAPTTKNGTPATPSATPSKQDTSTIGPGSKIVSENEPGDDIHPGALRLLDSAADHLRVPPPMSRVPEKKISYARYFGFAGIAAVAGGILLLGSTRRKPRKDIAQANQPLLHMNVAF